MKFDLNKPGLYYLLDTPEVKKRLQELESRAVLEKAEPAQIAKLVSRAIADEIEAYLRDKLEIESVNAGKNTSWVRSALNKFPSSSELSKIVENSLPVDDEVLTEVKLTSTASATDRPTTPLTDSELIVPNGKSPQLGCEIKHELKSCESADWLVSFIKIKAIRGFYDQLKAFCNQANSDGSPRLRIATTTYVGATDAEALRLLFELPNTQVKVCFNSSVTRLHAKAYIFRRKTQFGSAYIGSANLSSAALNTGLEWTVKVSQQEIPHLWERAISEFEHSWNDPDFEECTANDLPRITEALKKSKISYVPAIPAVNGDFERIAFHAEPHTYQRKMLDELMAEREHGQHRHLIVSATGTGKTYVAAFDYAQLTRVLGRGPKLLFLVHRTQIIREAREKYRIVLEQGNFGAILTEKEHADSTQLRQCFCTVQSWKTRIKDFFPKDFFDVIVMDECHHTAAKSYTEILNYYKEIIDNGKTDLLGLTATPFRGDGEDIRPFFGGDFTHELSLAEAIEHNHIVPFTYFGIDDDTDFSGVDWTKKKESAVQVERQLLRNQRHLDNITDNIYKYVADIANMRAIGFCAGIEHARVVAKHLNDKGISSVVLTGESTQTERDNAIHDMELIPPKIQAILTADLFNEGVDIPCVNTSFMLRPTNSPLVFVQQLGRGLRKAPLQYGKDDLLVLDFVGNHNERYLGFVQRFRSLSTRPDIPLQKQIKDGMPFLPAGCSVSLTQQGQEKVLKNIKKVMDAMKGQVLKRFLIQTIRDANERLSLKTLIESISAESAAPIFGVGTPSTLYEEAVNSKTSDIDVGNPFNSLAQNDSPLMIDYWTKVLTGNTADMSGEDIRIAKFFLLTSFDSRVRLENTDEKWNEFAGNKGLLKDLQEFFHWRTSHISPMKSKVFPQYTSRFLELHRTYNAQQISAALGRAGGVIMCGTDFNRERNVDTFFITRIKDEKDFSPTTMYEDYAKTPAIFHWQSPGRTTIASSEGQRYITNASKKMLFLRQTKRTRLDITGIYPIGSMSASYVFLGPVSKVLSHEGEKPISFDFELEYAMPANVFDFARGA